MDETTNKIVEQASGSSRAWWSGTVGQFLSSDHDLIANQLCRRAIETYRTNERRELEAWQWEIGALCDSLSRVPETWRLLFEYQLFRLGRRIDVLLICPTCIFVMEFKT